MWVVGGNICWVFFQDSTPQNVHKANMLCPAPYLSVPAHWPRDEEHLVVCPSLNAVGWRSLAGYSPWACKESDVIE